MFINNLDKKIILILFCISVIGIFAVYSASYQDGKFVLTAIFSKQLTWFCIGWLLLFVTANINYKLLYESAYVIYGLTLCLLVVVLFIGREALGAQRWLQLWNFTFQPSEIVKLTIIIVLSRYLCKKITARFNAALSQSGFIESILIPLVITIVPASLVFSQPDLGTAIVVFLLSFGVLFVSGVKIGYIVSLIAVGLLSLPFAWYLLKGYQQDRLLVFINPNSDPLGAGYSIIQSKIAIGSGGLLGKGLLSGTQSQLNFLPERHTDFIFSLIAEEGGFVGSIILLLLYFLLIYQIIKIGCRTNDIFARLICMGTGILFLLHIVINISMTSGVCPVVGIPLPFMSYGGTNLIINFVLLGIVLNIHKKNESSAI